MITFVKKDTQVSVRVSPSVKAELESLADYYGLSVTSLVHSFVVRAIRRERETVPEAFAPSETGILSREIHVSDKKLSKQRQG